MLSEIPFAGGTAAITWSGPLAMSYNEAGLLDRVEARIRAAIGWTTFVDDIDYDAVGNIVKMIHDAHNSVGDWTRHYHVAETSNRLLDTSLPGDDEEDATHSAVYEHDGTPIKFGVTRPKK